MWQRRSAAGRGPAPPRGGRTGRPPPPPSLGRGLDELSRQLTAQRHLRGAARTHQPPRAVAIADTEAACVDLEREKEGGGEVDSLRFAFPEHDSPLTLCPRLFLLASRI